MPPASISLTGRQCAGVVAVTGWVALTLQLIVTVDMTTGDGRTVGHAIWRYLSFFTILTNLLVALTLTRVARARWPGGTPADVSTITGVVLAIAIVGVTYHTLLSGRVPEMGPLWWTADRMLHYLIPAVSVLWWLAFVPAHRRSYRDPPAWLIFPASYLVYALVRGSFDGWYPYFFIDVSTLGYGRALLNSGGLAVGMLVAGYAVVAGARLLAPRRAALTRDVCA